MLQKADSVLALMAFTLKQVVELAGPQLDLSWTSAGPQLDISWMMGLERLYPDGREASMSHK